MTYFAPVPLILPFVLLLGFKLTGLRASLISVLVAIGIAALIVWDPSQILQTNVEAMQRAIGISFGVLTVLFPGLLLYKFQSVTGNLEKIVDLLTSLIGSKELQVVTLVIGVSPFLEAISGFGVSVLLVAPLLVALGFSNLKAGILVLLSQISVPLGALGVGTMIGAQLADMPQNEVGQASLILSAPLPALFAVISLVVAFGVDSARRFAIPAILAGLAKATGDYYLTGFVGIEVAGSLSCLFVITFLVLYDVVAPTDAHENRTFRVDGAMRACLPYLFLILALVVTRIIPPIQTNLLAIWNVDVLGSGFSYPLLYMPGTFIFAAVLLAILVNRVSWNSIGLTSKQTVKQFIPAGLTILFFILLSQIMIVSGMVAQIAELGTFMGSAYVPFVPILGALGGWLTGSNSGGNAMFMPMQVEIANNIGISEHLVAGAQNGAASYGTMGSPARIALASATLADKKIEGDLTRRMFAFVVFGAVVIGMAFACFVAFGFSNWDQNDVVFTTKSICREDDRCWR